MQTINIEVSKKALVAGKNEYVKVGDVAVAVPTLHELFPDLVKQAVDKDNAPVFDDDGLPSYEDDKLNWIQSAIAQQCKMQARNKLVNGTATLKPGAKIAETWEELLASGGGGNPAALEAVREAKKDFAAWVATLGKSAATQSLMTGMFNNKQGLELQSTGNKQKFGKYVEDFAGTLDEAKQAKYMKYLESLAAICDAEAVDLNDF